MFKWIEMAYRHYGLISVSGEILAEVTGSHPVGVFICEGKRFMGLEAAQRYAENRHSTHSPRRIKQQEKA